MKTRVVGLFFAFLASSALTAAESPPHLEWSVDTALAYTDNATLVDTDPTSESIGSVGGTIDFTREGPRLDARLRGDGAYEKYFDNTYGDEFLGSAATNILFRLVGDTLTWTLDDTFGQTTTNELEPDTPDNVSNVNVVSTGPDMTLRLPGTNELAMAIRYEDSTYQGSSSTDSQTWSGDAALVHRVSPAVAWSLHASASRVDYDSGENSGYDQEEAFGRLESRREGQELTADLGAAIYDDSGQTEYKPLVRIDWRRRLTPSWSVDVDAGSGFQNSGQEFDAGIANGTELGGTQDIILTDQGHEYDTANLSLIFARPRTTLTLTGGVDRERYPDSSDLDRDIWSLGAEASRRITEHLQATLNVDHEERTFDGSSTHDKTTMFALALDWRLGKALFLGLQGGTEKRTGDTGFSYDETVFQASLSYRPSGR